MKNAKKDYGKWYGLILKEDFKEVDINKVKLIMGREKVCF